MVAATALLATNPQQLLRCGFCLQVRLMLIRMFFLIFSDHPAVCRTRLPRFLSGRFRNDIDSALPTLELLLILVNIPFQNGQ